MLTVPLNDWTRRAYKQPTNIAAKNDELDQEVVERAKRLREVQNQKLASDNTWDALAETKH